MDEFLPSGDAQSVDADFKYASDHTVASSPASPSEICTRNLELLSVAVEDEKAKLRNTNAIISKLIRKRKTTYKPAKTAKGKSTRGKKKHNYRKRKDVKRKCTKQPKEGEAEDEEDDEDGGEAEVDDEDDEEDGEEDGEEEEEENHDGETGQKGNKNSKMVEEQPDPIRWKSCSLLVERHGLASQDLAAGRKKRDGKSCVLCYIRSLDENESEIIAVFKDTMEMSEKLDNLAQHCHEIASRFNTYIARLLTKNETCSYRMEDGDLCLTDIYDHLTEHTSNPRLIARQQMYHLNTFSNQLLDNHIMYTNERDPTEQKVDSKTVKLWFSTIDRITRLARSFAEIFSLPVIDNSVNKNFNKQRP